MYTIIWPVNDVTSIVDKERGVNHDSIVTQFKELIRVQDTELAELRQKLIGYDTMTAELAQLNQQVSIVSLCFVDSTTWTWYLWCIGVSYRSTKSVSVSQCVLFKMVIQEKIASRGKLMKRPVCCKTHNARGLRELQLLTRSLW